MKIFAAVLVLTSLFANGLVAGATEVRPDPFYIQVTNHTGDTIYSMLVGVGKQPVGIKIGPDETSDWETFLSTQSSGTFSYNCGGRGRSKGVFLKLSQPHIEVTILHNCESTVRYS